MRAGLSIAACLSLGTLLLTACDTDKDPGDPMVAGPGDTDGETDGETEGATEGDVPGTTVGGADGGGADGGEPATGACSEQGASQSCTTVGGGVGGGPGEGQPGVQYCDYESTGALTWHECLDLRSLNCELGETRSCGSCDDDEGGSTGGGSDGGDTDGICGTEYCYLYDGVPDWDANHSFDAGCNTPLVLSFDGAPAELVPARAATFDLDGVGGCISTDWPAAATPWLALDVDGSGTIDSGRELFGSGTLLPSGKRAAHGFMALSELDDNRDGRIDASDAAFAKLVLWGDEDGDRRSTFAEALPLAHHHVLSIDLGYRVDSQCDARGNCGIERAAFHFVDAHGAVRQGEVVDLHLSCQ